MSLGAVLGQLYGKEEELLCHSLRVLGSLQMNADRGKLTMIWVLPQYYYILDLVMHCVNVGGFLHQYLHWIYLMVSRSQTC